jgi:Ca2+-binding RTX toxin-like protein
MTGNAAANWLRGDMGNDTLRGGAGNDFINGGAGADNIAADAGNDVLEGMDGNDALSDNEGKNLFSGGSGADTLTGSAGHELYIGAAGNESITTGGGADVIAFNRGDNSDVITASAGADNTISVGGGIRYAEMTLSKSATDLVLNLGGADDRLTFKDWYAAPANRSVLNMQVIAEAMADFDAASSDKLRNKKIVTFDFLGLVGAFEAAGAPTNWALTNALLSKHLSGSDTAAIGADLAYRYGRTGSLSGMGVDAVQGMLGSASFGAMAQGLQSSAALDAGLKRLS